jgi:hypothetical protein
MEVYMELSKKTTILFPPELHERLKRLAKIRGVSIGELVRSACEAQYRLVPVGERHALVAEIASLDLPVSDTRTMKRQSVPDPKKLMR